MNANAGAPTSPAQPLSVFIRGVGVLGPGLPDWSSAAAVLRTPADWVSARTVLSPPRRLPPPERRRCGAIVKLTLAVADQACAQAGIDPRDLATVFASSSGDPDNCHALCEVLAGPDRLVSPTRFTNSVHNAAAGYWHIATTSRAPSTSVCCYDASFAAGLLEAVTQCVCWRRPVLLVASDVPYPQPLHAVRALPDAFGVALLLDCNPVDRALARLALTLAAGSAAAGSCGDVGLDALQAGVPAARSLPLLQALARAEPARLAFDDVGNVAALVDVADVAELSDSADKADLSDGAGGDSFALAVQLTPGGSP